MSTTIPFPQPLKTISLTDQTEIVKITELYNGKFNQFDMVNFQEGLDIKHVAIKFKISENKFNGYIIPRTLLNVTTDSKFRIQPISFHDNIQRNTAYFFVLKTIDKDNRLLLQKLIFNIWRSNIGPKRIDSIYFPLSDIRFKYIMPSRGKTFR